MVEGASIRRMSRQPQSGSINEVLCTSIINRGEVPYLLGMFVEVAFQEEG